MRTLLNQPAVDGEMNWKAAVGCVIMLLFIVVAPVVLHSDPMATGVFLVGP